jgi:hypothetical protein
MIGLKLLAALAIFASSDAFLAPQTFVHNRNVGALYMSWGPEPVWGSAKLASSVPACKSAACVSVTVELDPEKAKDYTIPGQYVQLRLNEETKPLFLAIACAPSDESNTFEFLIKKTEGNEWLTSAPVGTALEISQVLGKGFPMAENLDSLKYDFPTQVRETILG